MKAPGEDLIIKMWESLIDKGVGSLLSPMQIGREGKARNEVRRQEMLMLAQAETEANDIRAGRKQLLHDGSLKQLPSPLVVEAVVEQSTPAEHVITTASIADVSERTRVANGVKREINVAKAIIHAEEILASDTQTAPERLIDEDWITTWREYAQRVSTPKLQELWGQVLAGEVKSPGGYSLRTLDFLKGLSQYEAEQITKLAAFVIEKEAILKSGEKQLEANGIDFGFLLRIEDLGIIYGADALLSASWKTWTDDCYLRALRAHNKCLVVHHEDPQKKLTQQPAYILTTVGKELIGLGQFGANCEYLRAVGLSLMQQGFAVQLADWEQQTERQGRYFNPVELKPEVPRHQSES